MSVTALVEVTPRRPPGDTNQLLVEAGVLRSVLSLRQPQAAVPHCRRFATPSLAPAVNPCDASYLTARFFARLGTRRTSHCTSETFNVGQAMESTGGPRSLAGAEVDCPQATGSCGSKKAFRHCHRSRTRSKHTSMTGAWRFQFCFDRTSGAHRHEDVHRRMRKARLATTALLPSDTQKMSPGPTKPLQAEA